MLSGVSRNMKTQEQKVAVVLLENEDRIQTLSVADIAREAGVSKATVVRFCKSLGFRVWYEAGKGYQYTFLEPLSRESSLDDILRMIKAGTAKCVGKTLDESLLETLCRILQDMKNASSIAVVGEGDNAPFVQMFGEAIHLVFPNKTSILTTKEKIENTASASLCLIIPLSGSDKKTMNYLSSVILDGGKGGCLHCRRGESHCPCLFQSGPIAQ